MTFKIPVLYIKKIFTIQSSLERVINSKELLEIIETLSNIWFLCSESKNEKEGTTEHYFECKVSKQLADIWKVKIDDLKSTDVAQLKKVANFLEKTEILLQSEWSIQSNQQQK